METNSAVIRDLLKIPVIDDRHPPMVNSIPSFDRDYDQRDDPLFLSPPNGR